MDNINEILNGLILELRRSTIILSVLSQLKEPQYGYSLVQRLEDKGVPVEPGTLYPLLRRLEKQDLLESKWEVDSARPRRYYVLSPAGKKTLKSLQDEWNSLNRKMLELFE